MSNLAVWQWVAIAIVVLMNVGIWAGPALSLLSNIKLPSIGTAKSTTAIPGRTEVMADLDGAYAYFKSINCQEGMDHVDAAGKCAWAQHPQAEAKA